MHFQPFQSYETVQYIGFNHGRPSFQDHHGYNQRPLPFLRFASFAQSRISPSKWQHQILITKTSFVIRVDDGSGVKNSSLRTGIRPSTLLSSKAVQSDSCISMTKLAGGGYNKVFPFDHEWWKNSVYSYTKPKCRPSVLFHRVRGRYHGACKFTSNLNRAAAIHA